METRKVTVTLGKDQLEAIQRLVARGQTPSVSGFLQHAVRIALSDVAGWRSMLEDALEGTGGPLTESEIAWADGVLGVAGTRRRRRRKVA